MPTFDSSAPFTGNHESYEKRGAPKIGGSVGGFIALVVCLCLVIVISCTAIFLLLRDRDPSETERAHRRRKHREEVNAKYLGATSPWTTKVAHIFSSGKPKSSAEGPTHTQGWVQAGTTDEWDTESLDEGRTRGMEMTYSEHLDPPFRPPYPTEDSASSVHFDLGTKMPSFPSPRVSVDHNYMYRSGTSSENGTPLRVLSPEPMTPSRPESPFRNDARKSSTQSTNRAFNGGTKFIESV
ncbi:hypothetical protein BDZ89DRAFT_1067386 [Hymenopellis radicata]|nr:hypothetical protein BDZ89DRAFT_1067386 [Hymenopellis radicata]